MKLFFLQLTLLLALVTPTAAIFGFWDRFLERLDLEGLIDTLFSNFLNTFATAACTAGTLALGLTNPSLSCSCSAKTEGIFDFLSNGFQVGGSADCTAQSCLFGIFFCGAVDVKLDVEAGGDGFDGNVTSCFAVDAGLPRALTDVFDLPERYDICIKAVTERLSLTDCELSIAEQTCSECMICDNGFTFMGNCSNVDLTLGLLEFVDVDVPGPVIDSCTLLSGTPFNGLL